MGQKYFFRENINRHVFLVSHSRATRVYINTTHNNGATHMILAISAITFLTVYGLLAAAYPRRQPEASHTSREGFVL